MSLPFNLLRRGCNIIANHNTESEEKKQLWIVMAAINLPFVAYLLAVGTMDERIVVIVLLVLTAAYSLRPIRLRDIPLVDSVVASAQIVLPFVLGVTLATTHSWYLPGIAAFAIWAITSHLLGLIQHVSSDHGAGKRTLATFLGVRWASLVCFWLYAASIVIVAVTFWPSGLLAAVLLSVYPINVSFFFKYKSDAKAELFARAWTNFISLNFVIGAWLVLLLIFMLDHADLGPARILLLGKFLIVFAILQLLLIIHNLMGFRRPKHERLHDYPKVSLLIHAYNQAENISSTMLALLGQNYPDYEIIFADLGSSDNTANIVSSYQDPKIRELQIEPLPEDWSINSWAAQQLLEQARGDIVVLVSADTVLLPDTVASLVSLLLDPTRKLDIVSLLPADQNKTLGQKLLLSLNRFFWIGLYPAAYLTKNFPQYTAVYSGLMAARRDRLTELDGFSLVRKSPLEDLDLPSAAKQHNLKTAFYFGSDLTTTQNHANFRLIILQDIQRYYPSLHFSFPLTVAMVTGGLFVSCLPLTLLINAAANGHHTEAIVLLIGIGMTVGNRLIVAATSRQSYWATIFYPFSSLIAYGLMIVSVFQYELMKPRWQKRTEL